MSFGRYWGQILSANPGLDQSGSLKLDVSTYKAAIKRAYDRGRSDQVEADNVGSTKKSISVSGPLASLERLADVFFNGRPAR